MKMVISAGATKRIIEGPYAICGSHQDMLILQQALDHAMAEDRNFSYGWVNISERAQLLGNTQPEPWE